MNLLDLGCGPGSITLDLAELVAPGRVTGVENVEPPLTTARAQAARRGVDNVTFEEADGTALPYPDDTFDVVHAHQVLQHVSDPVRVLTEMARVCRPGGTIAVRDADYEVMTWYPPSTGMTTWLDTYRAIAKANGAEPDAGRYLRSWARRAGLTGVEVTASTWCYATPEATRWWGDSQAERVLTDTFVEQAAAQGVDGAGVERMSAAWRRWGQDPDAFFVMVHGELLATPASRPAGDPSPTDL